MVRHDNDSTDFPIETDFSDRCTSNVEHDLASAEMQSLTEHENHMMRNGTFVYGALSPQQQEALFDDFQGEYSREVQQHLILTLPTFDSSDPCN